MAPSSNFLERLPLELVEYILSMVDQGSEPPSTRLLLEPPSESLFKDENKGSLKCLSLTSWAIRRLVTPMIFKHLRISAGQVAGFIEGFNKNNFVDLIKFSQTLLLYFELDIYTTTAVFETHPDFGFWGYLRADINQMCNIVNPRAMTIVAHTNILGWLLGHRIAGCALSNRDPPYQLIRLEQDLSARNPYFLKDKVRGSCLLSSLRPWNHLTFNEGSFARAFVENDRHWTTPLSLYQAHMQKRELSSYASRLACLKSFKLVAVFPFNHQEQISFFLECLPNLEHLTVQLCPVPDDQKQCESIWPDHDPLSDSCWQEQRINYAALGYRVNRNFKRLSKLTTLDYLWPNYQAAIQSEMKILSYPWKHDGKGTWTR